jgi:hypothetical protein
MSVRLSVIGEPSDLSLAGLPEATPPTDRDRPLVVLGDAEAASAPPAVRWLDRAPREGDPPAERLVAPVGSGLWRRAPWPAADALFGLPPAAGGLTLLAGADAELREDIAERAAARGVAVEQVERIDADRLEAAACVILAESPGGALPARAFSVLAAARLLIVPRLSTSFGLEDGLDHLEFAEPYQAVTFVQGYRRTPEAFARVTAWGRVKAGPQRASVAYGRLAADLRAHGVADRA